MNRRATSATTIRRAAMRGLAFLLMAAAIAPAAGAQLEVYGRLPAMAQATISPSGSQVAYVRSDGDEPAIVIWSKSKASESLVLRLGAVKVRSLTWVDDAHLLVFKSATWRRGVAFEVGRPVLYDIDRDKWTVIPDELYLKNIPDQMRGVFRLGEGMSGWNVVRNIDGHAQIFLSTGISISRKALVALQRSNPDAVPELIPLMDKDADLAHPLSALLQIDVKTDEARLARIGPPGTTDRLIDAAGRIVAEESYSEKDQRWSITVSKDGTFEEVAGGRASLEHSTLTGFGPAAGTLLVHFLESDVDDSQLWNLRRGGFEPAPDEIKSIGMPIAARLTGLLVGGVRTGGGKRYRFLDPAVQADWDSIAEAYKGSAVKLVAQSDDFKNFLLLVDDARSGVQYVLADVRDYRTYRLGNVYDGSIRTHEVRAIRYPAADGLTIPAYLTLPKAATAKGLPLVVLVHGGPASHDEADFDWWSQALADQGYAVLRSNYRGSDVSRALLVAGFGEYGRKMQSDLSDGVRFLAHDGVIDPARVCIVGASYGGYAALAGATLDASVYRCAVSVAGISDLKAMLEWVDEMHDDKANREQRFWDRFMGVSGPNDPLLSRISPVHHVDAVRAPVLLIHGKDDTVVPLEQSVVMYDALRNAGKDVAFVKLPGEDHWLSRSDTRLQMLRATVDFVRRHNPPD